MTLPTAPTGMLHAHSLPGHPPDRWETLTAHSGEVAAMAAGFAAVFGWAELARAAGWLHDIGKASAAYQDYIRRPPDKAHKGPDHSTAGAREAKDTYGRSVPGRVLTAVIAGHHAGLADIAELRSNRLDPANRSIEPYDGWQRHLPPLPPLGALLPGKVFRPSPLRGFSEAFLTRMVFSALVDADRLCTAAFYDRAEGRPAPEGGKAVPEAQRARLEVLRARLEAHMAALSAQGSEAVLALRLRVLDHARERAALEPGLFTLTVPTGGGKTLASLSFALEHARRHGMRRVVYVVPFTAIIEQTVDVFRDALGTTDDVLEHHSAVDWDGDEEERALGADSLARLRRASENWDAPIVVTTAVQFFESLFAARTSRCRRLHNLAGAVIVLDEVQATPLPVLRPCMAALDELARNYRSSVVLCTATQPALREQDEFCGGFDIGDERELAPEPRALYEALRRVRVETRRAPVSDAEIAARFAEQPRMLCIVNARAHAAALYAAIRSLPGAMHLSTLMCGRHRRAVLARARARLQCGKPVRLVSTSLIEAGVDISFPEVWREAAGLDSIAQAAGRCNRHGLLEEGRVVVFTATEDKVPHGLKAFRQAALPVLEAFEDPLGLEAVRAYFQALYWQQGDYRQDGQIWRNTPLDTTAVQGRPGILAALHDASDKGAFPFQAIADAFRLIDERMKPVIVPYDEDAQAILARIGAMDRPLSVDLRRLQPYAVSIPVWARDAWLKHGALAPVHPGLPDGPLRFLGDAPYDRHMTGLDLDATGMLMRPEDTMF